MTVLIEETGTVTKSELEQMFFNDPNIQEDDGSTGNHHAHIIDDRMNDHIWEKGMKPQEVVDIARLTGQEITALCGYKWVPKRNPEKFDICPTCLTIGNDMIDRNA